MKAVLKSMVIINHNAAINASFLSFMSLDLATQIIVTNIPKS